MTEHYNQVSVDLFNMVYTALGYLALAGAAWLFLRLIQACFWLPNHMKRQNNVQQMLEDKVNSYERYIKECEEKETSGEVKDVDDDGITLEQRKKERQECLDMLRNELKRIRDGGDPYDFKYLLGEDEKKLLDDLDEEDEMEKDDEKHLERELLENDFDNNEDTELLDPELKKDK